MEKCCRNCKHHRYRAGESFCKYDAEIKGCMQRVSPDSSCSNFEEGVYTVPQGSQPNNGSLQTLENRSTAKPIPPASQNPYGIRDGLKLAGIAYLLGIIPIVASVSGIMLLIAFIKSFNARDVYNQKKKDIFSILLILIVFLIEIALFVGAFFLNYSYFQSMFSNMDSSTMDSVYESIEWEKLIPTFILSGVAYLVYIIAGILALVKSKKVEPMKQSTSTSYLLPGVSYTKQDGQLLASNHSPQAYQTEQSKFTGGAFMWFLIRFATYAISGLFLGLLYPLMKCTELRWKAEHTYYNGKRLSFDGTAGELFGKYILWILLTIITCGIYSLFMAVNLKRWEIKHTHIAGMNGESEFTGGAFGLFGVRLLTGIVTVITLFLGSFWAHCYKEKWFARHQVIDGCSINFDGTAMEYFGNRIKWFLLTCITCGIYVFWLQVKSKQWTVKHTYIENIEAYRNKKTTF